MQNHPVITQLAACANTLSGIAGSLDPDEVLARQAPDLWLTFDRLERLAAGAKLLLARRVDDSKVWQHDGYRSAAEWCAARASTSITSARAAQTTSRRLAKLPRTTAALRRGAISAFQAEPIADAAAHAPSSEAGLLDLANRASLAELRDEAGRAKAAADPDPDATRRRIHRRRQLRTYTDGEGAWCLRGRGPVDHGSLLETTLGPIIDEIFRAAHAEGRREAREAYAFDALIELARRSHDNATTLTRKTSKNPKYLGLLRIDLEALTRGSVAGGELCEITGLGPISVTRARELLGDAVLKLIITKGVDVAHVTSLGRGPTAAQKIALLWSQPTCSVEGCHRSLVEHDHRLPWAQRQETRLDNLDNHCSHHHDLKTRLGWALVDGVGKRAMVPPSDSRHPGAMALRHKPTAA